MTEYEDGEARGTLLVIDGHSLAFRAFFALPVESFSTAQGKPTNAVWGFASMLSQVINAERPDHLAIAFDVKGGTFRNTMLPQYKGTRDAAPQDLLDQLPLIQRMLDALGVTYIEKPGYEGDDIIGTLATMGEQARYRTLVLSGDRDAFQLVDDWVTVLYPGYHFKDLKHMTPDEVFAKYHVMPAQYPDLAALRGETADNIPGVPGVGDGYAAKWIGKYGSLEALIEHADDIGGKKGEALRANLDQVRLNRKVNALVRDVDLGVTVEDLTFGQVDVDKLDALFDELEFGARTKNRVLKTFNNEETAKTQAAQPQQDENIVLPNGQRAHDVKELRDWASAHLPAPVRRPDVGELPSGNDEATSGIDHSARCSEAIEHSWVLNACGNAKPGRVSTSSVTLLCAGEALVLQAPLDEDLRDALGGIIDAHASGMVVHGYKEQLHLFSALGLALPYPLFDTELAGYLAQPDFHAESLEQAASHFLDIHADQDEPATQGMLDLGADGDVDSDPDAGKLKHAAIIAALARFLAPKLDMCEQFGLLQTLELPVSRVLQKMEAQGAKVDTQRLKDMRDGFAADARQAQEIAWQWAGREVNLQSPKQLSEVLFEDMGLKPTKRTKKGAYTTNADALQTLYMRSVNDERANGFLGALLRHRETNKLKQIVGTLIETINPFDGRIHTTFEQTVAATGRLSSADPNLQNIPNRNAVGREIRSAFIPGEGYESLVSCDYSQVELRIMAHLSGDEALIEAFRSGVDFHRYVASLVHQVPVDQITADQRTHVKAMSYGLAYGLSSYGLAQQLKINPGEAEALKQKYFSTFGKVRDFLESCVSEARRRGYTETMFGRRRYFPALHSTNRSAREAAERAALNAPIQGSAADIMKVAMIRASRALQEAGLKSRIILQIHDELVVEVVPGEAQQVTELVRNAMETAVRLDVPLDVSTGIGADWQLAAH
ncbi:DNA polymerase I [Bifidobacterium panos]|uniref:DNA polymerase I n=1 Tax=Bifidobacterium panos TaxID=2675321 RepID=A0ABX1SWJ2_9BIFI|nr:DNA polymerase I [Bifidobacterium sp. DSM 109963]NMN01502.1 DNA-directed DNA polymerase [Bifidobacterium sp. DSM 109963]